MSGLPNVAKQIVAYLANLAMLPDYRAHRWLVTKPDIALLTRYSQYIDCGNEVEFTFEQEHTMQTLTHGMAHGYIGITRAHEYEGLAWLWSQHKNHWLGERELTIMQHFSHYSLAGLNTEIAQGHLHLRRSTPIWRVHALEGETFEYEAWSWQSGRKPRLV